MLEPGDHLGDWEIEGLLGEGGMGAVYRARNVVLGDVHAAVKTTLPRDFQHARERFIREIKALLRLHHPAVVRVQGFGEDRERGLLWFAMDLVEGHPLDSWIEGGAAFPVSHALKLYAELAEGLAHAHERGVAHRDLKPANVIVRTDGSPVMVDFGISATEGEDRLTRTGTVIGTPQYMPPEALEGHLPDPMLGDIYALGQMFMETLIGAPVFPIDPQLTSTQNALRVMHQKVNRDALDPGDAFPEAVRDLIRQATHLNPQERLGSVAELAQRLRALSDQPAEALLATAHAGGAAAGLGGAVSPGQAPAKGAAETVDFSAPQPSPGTQTLEPALSTPAAPARRPVGVVLGLAGGGLLALVIVVIGAVVVGGGAAWWLLVSGSRGVAEHGPAQPESPAVVAAPADPGVRPEQSDGASVESPAGSQATGAAGSDSSSSGAEVDPSEPDLLHGQRPPRVRPATSDEGSADLPEELAPDDDGVGAVEPSSQDQERPLAKPVEDQSKEASDEPSDVPAEVDPEDSAEQPTSTKAPPLEPFAPSWLDIASIRRGANDRELETRFGSSRDVSSAHCGRTETGRAYLGGGLVVCRAVFGGARSVVVNGDAKQELLKRSDDKKLRLLGLRSAEVEAIIGPPQARIAENRFAYRHHSVILVFHGDRLQSMIVNLN